jgi:hypothetical protein
MQIIFCSGLEVFSVPGAKRSVHIRVRYERASPSVACKKFISLEHEIVKAIFLSLGKCDKSGKRKDVTVCRVKGSGGAIGALRVD